MAIPKLKPGFEQEDFLFSHNGSLVHELSHHIASNIDGLIRGHLVISVDDFRQAAFCIMDEDRDILNRSPGRCRLVASAAIIAEMDLIGGTVPSRGTMDALEYKKQLKRQIFKGDLMPLERALLSLENRDLITRWRNIHRKKLAKTYRYLHRNFDLCVGFVADGTYIIDGFHVIPSSRLVKPIKVSEADVASEKAMTDNLNARNLALISCKSDWFPYNSETPKEKSHGAGSTNPSGLRAAGAAKRIIAYLSGLLGKN